MEDKEKFELILKRLVQIGTKIESLEKLLDTLLTRLLINEFLVRNSRAIQRKNMNLQH